MSEAALAKLAEAEAAIDFGGAPEGEDGDAMAARHAEETRAIDDAVAAALAAAPKSKKKKKEVRQRCEEVQRRLWEAHGAQRREGGLDELFSAEDEDEDAGAEGGAPTTGDEPPAAEDTGGGGDDQSEEAAERDRRKARALRKREKKKKKEEERERQRLEDLARAGPSAREVELDRIQAALAALSPPMRVVEVASDGHCLYRAVAKQLCLAASLPPAAAAVRRDCEAEGGGAGGFRSVRRCAAASLRENAEDLAAFVEGDFGAHCERVEESADWGGHVELQALARKLQLPILVHRAGEPPLEVGGPAEAEGAAIHVSYHHSYYALGEHYNSVEAA